MASPRKSKTRLSLSSEDGDDEHKLVIVENEGSESGSAPATPTDLPVYMAGPKKRFMAAFIHSQSSSPKLEGLATRGEPQSNEKEDESNKETPTPNLHPLEDGLAVQQKEEEQTLRASRKRSHEHSESSSSSTGAQCVSPPQRPQSALSAGCESIPRGRPPNSNLQNRVKVNTPLMHMAALASMWPGKGEAPEGGQSRVSECPADASSQRPPEEADVCKEYGTPPPKKPLLVHSSPVQRQVTGTPIASPISYGREPKSEKLNSLPPKQGDSHLDYQGRSQEQRTQPPELIHLPLEPKDVQQHVQPLTQEQRMAWPQEQRPAAPNERAKSPRQWPYTHDQWPRSQDQGRSPQEPRTHPKEMKVNSKHFPQEIRQIPLEQMPNRVDQKLKTLEQKVWPQEGRTGLGDERSWPREQKAGLPGTFLPVADRQVGMEQRQLSHDPPSLVNPGTRHQPSRSLPDYGRPGSTYLGIYPGRQELPTTQPGEPVRVNVDTQVLAQASAMRSSLYLTPAQQEATAAARASDPKYALSTAVQYTAVARMSPGQVSPGCRSKLKGSSPHRLPSPSGPGMGRYSNMVVTGNPSSRPARVSPVAKGSPAASSGYSALGASRTAHRTALAHSPVTVGGHHQRAERGQSPMGAIYRTKAGHSSLGTGIPAQGSVKYQPMAHSAVPSSKISPAAVPSPGVPYKVGAAPYPGVIPPRGVHYQQSFSPSGGYIRASKPLGPDQLSNNPQASTHPLIYHKNEEMSQRSGIPLNAEQTTAPPDVTDIQPLDLSKKQPPKPVHPPPQPPTPAKLPPEELASDTPLDLSIKKDAIPVDTVKTAQIWYPTQERSRVQRQVQPTPPTKSSRNSPNPLIQSLQDSVHKHLQSVQKPFHPLKMMQNPDLAKGVPHGGDAISPSMLNRFFPEQVVAHGHTVAKVKPRVNPVQSSGQQHPESYRLKPPPSQATALQVQGYPQPIKHVPSPTPRKPLVGRAEPITMLPPGGREEHLAKPGPQTAVQGHVSPAGGRQRGNTALIGSHPVDDILYLKCNLCAATYGSPHSFRKHFIKVHGFDPNTEHVTVRSILAAKGGGKLDGPHLMAGKTPHAGAPGHQGPPPSYPISPGQSPNSGSPMSVASLSPSQLSPGQNILQDIKQEAPSGDVKNMAEVQNFKSSSTSRSRSMQCFQCGQDFPTRDWGVFKRHMRAHESPQLRCNICRQTFADENEFKDHNMTYHPIQSYMCSQCNVSFPHPAALTKHVKLVHQEPAPSEASLPCLYCSQTFVDPAQFSIHIKDHEKTMGIQGGIQARIQGGHQAGSPAGSVRRASPDSTSANPVDDGQVKNAAIAATAAVAKGCKMEARVDEMFKLEMPGEGPLEKYSSMSILDIVKEKVEEESRKHLFSSNWERIETVNKGETAREDTVKEENKGEIKKPDVKEGSKESHPIFNISGTSVTHRYDSNPSDVFRAVYMEFSKKVDIKDQVTTKTMDKSSESKSVPNKIEDKSDSSREIKEKSDENLLRTAAAEFEERIKLKDLSQMNAKEALSTIVEKAVMETLIHAKMPLRSEMMPQRWPTDVTGKNYEGTASEQSVKDHQTSTGKELKEDEEIEARQSVTSSEVKENDKKQPSVSLTGGEDRANDEKKEGQNSPDTEVKDKKEVGQYSTEKDEKIVSNGSSAEQIKNSYDRETSTSSALEQTEKDNKVEVRFIYKQEGNNSPTSKLVNETNISAIGNQKENVQTSTSCEQSVTNNKEVSNTEQTKANTEEVTENRRNETETCKSDFTLSTTKVMTVNKSNEVFPMEIESVKIVHNVDKSVPMETDTDAARFTNANAFSETAVSEIKMDMVTDIAMNRDKTQSVNYVQETKNVCCETSGNESIEHFSIVAKSGTNTSKINSIKSENDVKIISDINKNLKDTSDNVSPSGPNEKVGKNLDTCATNTRNKPEAEKQNVLSDSEELNSVMSKHETELALEKVKIGNVSSKAEMDSINLQPAGETELQHREMESGASQLKKNEMLQQQEENEMSLPEMESQIIHFEKDDVKSQHQTEVENSQVKLEVETLNAKIESESFGGKMVLTEMENDTQVEKSVVSVSAGAQLPTMDTDMKEPEFMSKKTTKVEPGSQKDGAFPEEQTIKPVHQEEMSSENQSIKSLETTAPEKIHSSLRKDESDKEQVENSENVNSDLPVKKDDSLTVPLNLDSENKQVGSEDTGKTSAAVKSKFTMEQESHRSQPCNKRKGDESVGKCSTTQKCKKNIDVAVTTSVESMHTSDTKMDKATDYDGSDDDDDDDDSQSQGESTKKVSKSKETLPKDASSATGSKETLPKDACSTTGSKETLPKDACSATGSKETLPKDACSTAGSKDKLESTLCKKIQHVPENKHPSEKAHAMHTSDQQHETLKHPDKSNDSKEKGKSPTPVTPGLDPNTRQGERSTTDMCTKTSKSRSEGRRQMEPQKFLQVDGASSSPPSKRLGGASSHGQRKRVATEEADSEQHVPQKVRSCHVTLEDISHKPEFAEVIHHRFIRLDSIESDGDAAVS